MKRKRTARAVFDEEAGETLTQSDLFSELSSDASCGKMVALKKLLAKWHRSGDKARAPARQRDTPCSRAAQRGAPLRPPSLAANCDL